MVDPDGTSPRNGPAVLVISSLVGRGAIGGGCATFALQRLGFPVWLVPTVSLPFHPGHGSATRIVPPAEDFKSTLDDIAASPWLGEIGAVLIGYLGAPGQAPAIAGFVARARAVNSALRVHCDPVIGDEGGAYVSDEILAAQADYLLPLADVATPNRYELEMLVGRKLGDNGDLREAAAALHAETVLVTSAYPMMKNSTGNLLVTGDRALLAEHRLLKRAPHGTGDLLAGLFLGRCLEGRAAEEALSLASASVFEVLARSVQDGRDELQVVAGQAALARPQAKIQIRQLGGLTRLKPTNKGL